MALCWSVAEYCAPVWSRSSHTGLIDTRLNDSMRIITGSLRPTPLAWLPVLANIPPPTIRRESLAASFAASIVDREELPLHVDLAHHPPLRLTSRNPIWQSPHDVDINLKWREKWEANPPTGAYLIDDPTSQVPGFDLPRREWVSLNRYRTGVGRCFHNLHKWGYSDSPSCKCGASQTMAHIVNDCPLSRFEGGLTALHTASTSAVDWLRRDHCIR